MVRNKEFNYGERKLEVKACQNGDDWEVRVFENGKPANLVIYHVSGLTNDLIDGVGNLMQLAQDYFIKYSDSQK